jgi:hypothetical protein
MVNEWHADPVYTHDVNAIETFWLMTMFRCITPSSN